MLTEALWIHFLLFGILFHWYFSAVFHVGFLKTLLNIMRVVLAIVSADEVLLKPFKPVLFNIGYRSIFV